jgi:hypothetical protein
MLSMYIIVELVNGDLYIGWVWKDHFDTSERFVLHVDRTYHTSGLDSVVLWNHVIREVVAC